MARTPPGGYRAGCRAGRTGHHVPVAARSHRRCPRRNAAAALTRGARRRSQRSSAVAVAISLGAGQPGVTLGVYAGPPALRASRGQSGTADHVGAAALLLAGVVTLPPVQVLLSTAAVPGIGWLVASRGRGRGLCRCPHTSPAARRSRDRGQLGDGPRKRSGRHAPIDRVQRERIFALSGSLWLAAPALGPADSRSVRLRRNAAFPTTKNPGDAQRKWADSRSSQLTPFSERELGPFRPLPIRRCGDRTGRLLGSTAYQHDRAMAQAHQSLRDRSGSDAPRPGAVVAAQHQQL